MRSFISTPARRRCLGFGVPLVLAAATSVWMHAHPKQETKSVVTTTWAATTPAITASATAPADAPGAFVELTMTLDTQVGALQGTKLVPFATLRTSGTMVERVLAKAGAETVVLLAVDNPSVTLGDAHQADVENALATGIVLARDVGGTTTRVRLPKGISTNGQRVLRTLADLRQWTPTADAGGEANEVTSLGMARVHYTRDDAQHVHKTIARIEEGTRESLQGTLAATLEGSRIAGLHGDETLTTRNKSGVSATHVSLEQTRTGVDLARSMQATLALEDRFHPWMAVDAAAPHAATTDANVLVRTVAGRSLADFEDALAKAEDGRAQMDVVDGLHAFLVLNPDACAKVAADAAHSTPKDALAQARVMALLQAGTPEAQHALFDVVKAWRDVHDGATLVSALGTVSAPTAETIDGLRALREDHAMPALATRSADVALGNIANRLRDTDPSRADAIAAELSERLSASSNPADVASTLVALGNSGSERARDVAVPYLEDGDPHVRRMAVFAYGRVADDDARSTLKRIAETDPDASVREEASRFLGI